MAPKIAANAAKLALIFAWFQKTGVAHNIKDLEKAIPQVASINAMQVKDYLQALSDENMIRVEKIGSGNWYWSFPSEAKRTKEAALEKARNEYEKANETAMELQERVNDAGAARGEDEGMLSDLGMDRKALIIKHTDLTKEIELLREGLAAYSKQDPVEVDRKDKETQQFRTEAGEYTDRIFTMEDWLKRQVGGDVEQMDHLKREHYGDEYDEEDGGLREL